jgi:nitroreductase
MDLDKAIKERHTTRNFKKNKVPNYKDIIEAIEAARQCPLAGNHPAIKVILVSDKEKIKQLAEASQQDFIADVSYAAVFCSDKKFLTKNYYERAHMYSRQQAGAAIQNFLLKLTDLKLQSCWVGAFSDETVKRILAIPDQVDIEAIIPIGYELGKARKIEKPELDSMLFFDTYNNKLMKQRRMPESTTV